MFMIKNIYIFRKILRRISFKQKTAKDLKSSLCVRHFTSGCYSYTAYSGFKKVKRDYQNMFPVLHQVNVSFINYKYFYWGEEIIVSLVLPFSSYHGSQAKGRCNDNVRGVKRGIQPHALLKNRNTCSDAIQTYQPVSDYIFNHRILAYNIP